MLSFGTIASKVFGSSNDRRLKKYASSVAAINALEPEIVALSDEDLRARTEAFRARVREGTPLDDLIPEAFATVREAAKRTIGQRHFDVQMIGGMVLHEGRIAEMKTGEGKTLVATLAVYLNALASRGVHVVTVNDYLAERYAAIDTFIPKLEAGDFELDEKTRIVTLTEAGNEHVEQLLTEADLLKGESLYDIENVTVVHHVQQALRAHKLFQRDRDYIVK